MRDVHRKLLVDQRWGQGKAGFLIISFFMLLILSGCGGGSTTQTVESPPPAPTGVQVVITNASTLTISWNSVASAATYNVYWSTSLGASKSSTKIAGITATNYIHTGRTSGTTYYYVVTAVNSYGESVVSAEVFVLLDVPTPPGAIAAVAGDNEVTLSWNANGATSYNVYMASQSGVTVANYSTLTDGMPHPAVTSPFNHTGLVNGKTYYFVVTSVNSFGESIESSEVSVTPAASSSLTVSGSVKYEDKEYGAAGFTGVTKFKAVRYAAVEAVNAANSATIASGTTDAAGSYNLTIPPANSGNTVYVRVLSSASTPGSPLTPMVNVKYPSTALYAAAGANFSASGAAMANISVPVTSPSSGAFNIVDVFVSGAQFVQSLAGSYPPVLNAYWELDNQNGTYYCASYTAFACSRGEGIYVLNSGQDMDTDEYDDDVLWHEYGHFIAENYSWDDSPGGAHTLTANDLDLRLAWSEGWGDFFPAAVKAWLATFDPSLLSTASGSAASQYVDTFIGSWWTFDFVSLTGSTYIYSANEIAVAGVLWRTMNETTSKMAGIWDVFVNFIPAVTDPVSLESFWDGWLARQSANGSLGAIFDSRFIFYKPDSCEVDDSASAVKGFGTCGGNVHYLYASGVPDLDFISFYVAASDVGKTYTAKTSALNNGADTYLTIYDALMTKLTENDNTSGTNYAGTVPNICDVWGVCHPNILDTLASTASFMPAASGVYYVEVKSSPNRPLSAGKYGGYTLSITSQ